MRQINARLKWLERQAATRSNDSATPTHEEIRQQIEAIERHARYNEFLELCRQAALASDSPNATAKNADVLKAARDKLSRAIQRDELGCLPAAEMVRPAN